MLCVLVALASCVELETGSIDQAATKGDPVDDPAAPPDREPPPDPDPDPDGPQPPNPPPSAPPEGTSVVRISSQLLNSAVSVFLGNSLVTVDSTTSAPPRSGPTETVCVWPNAELRDAAYADCYASFSGASLFRCLRIANEEFPNISECFYTSTVVRGYIDFPSIAETEGARDITFPVEPIQIDDLTIDINWLRSDPETPPAASISEFGLSIGLPLVSNQPTLPCARDGLIGCPDVELTNMRVMARFTPGPGPDYSCVENKGTAPACTVAISSARVSMGLQHTSFLSDLNLSNIPDFFVTAFFDVESAISDLVEAKLAEALRAPAARAAIERAVTGLAIQRVRTTTHPTISGFSRINQVWLDGNDLVIRYEWY